MTRRQFLERPALVPVGGRVLEALSHRGRRLPPLLVVPPPPGEGGMDHVLAVELAWAATRAGHPTLRFNFRGVGASQGPAGDPGSRLEDIAAALQVLRENASAAAVAVAALGGSATDVLRVARASETVAGAALVHPRRLSPGALAGLRLPLLVVVAEAPLAGTLEAALGAASADRVTATGLPEVGRSVARWLGKLPTP